MVKAVCNDTDFVHLFEDIGPGEMARRLKVNVRSVHARRKNLERKLGRDIRWSKLPDGHVGLAKTQHYPHRMEYDISDGVVLVGSDGHYWPGPASVAHRAFVKFCKELKPRLVVMNGDALDGASISRHAPIGWENRPTLIDEIEVCKERLGEIEAAAFKAHKVWNLGNHDARFETRLATVAPEFAKVHGVHLKDHFPLWQPAWSCWINSDVVVKHRIRGGDHAPFNNTLRSGKTTVTGHLHSAKVIPYDDYNGRRYGMDTGCLADVYGPQFTDYTEDGPLNWRSAFGVLTFRDYRLMQPELVLAVDEGHVEFRGELIRV